MPQQATWLHSLQAFCYALVCGAFVRIVGSADITHAARVTQAIYDHQRLSCGERLQLSIAFDVLRTKKRKG
jgi:hypothetical protein